MLELGAGKLSRVSNKLSKSSWSSIPEFAENFIIIGKNPLVSEHITKVVGKLTQDQKMVIPERGNYLKGKTRGATLSSKSAKYKNLIKSSLLNSVYHIFHYFFEF